MSVQITNFDHQNLVLSLFQAVSGLPDPTGEKERHNSESDSQAAGSGSEDTKDQVCVLNNNTCYGGRVNLVTAVMIVRKS